MLLVFIGAFTPLPYKVIAVSAGIAVMPRNAGDVRIVMILLSTLVLLFGGAIWLTH